LRAGGGVQMLNLIVFGAIVLTTPDAATVSFSVRQAAPAREGRQLHTRRPTRGGAVAEIKVDQRLIWAIEFRGEL